MTNTPNPNPSTNGLIGAMADHIGSQSLDKFIEQIHKENAAGMSEVDIILDTLADVIGQACSCDGELDSMALSAYADGLRLLAKYGRVKIVSEYGRRVIAEWVK